MTDSARISDSQRACLFALWGEAAPGGDRRTARLRWASRQLGREVESFGDLTTDEASRLIASLETLKSRRGLRSNETQAERLLQLLEKQSGEWVQLPLILNLRIAAYGACIHRLRRRGHVIENRTERDPLTGTLLSWYRLIEPRAQVASKQQQGEAAA